MFARSLLMASGQRQIMVTISANVRSPDIAALATSQGWRGTENITLVINAGVDVATLQIAGIPDDRLHVVNNGRIGGVVNSGTGLYTRARIRVTNNGTIFGGGGQGGSGGSAWVKYKFDDAIDWAYGGNGGNGAGFQSSGAVVMLAATAGLNGTYKQYAGAVLGGETPPWAQGGYGGNGGAIGQTGIDGNAPTWGGTYQTHGEGAYYSGVAAGYYVDGNAYITWLATGTRFGRVI